MPKLQVTFKGNTYDITISGDNIQEIKSEYAKVKKQLEKVISPQRTRGTDRPKPVLSGLGGLLNQRIMEMISDDFFKTPKTLPDVRFELKNRGYPYGQPSIGMSLLRLVRKKALRRIIEAKNGKKQYFYTNP